MEANFRASTPSETRGFLKALLEADSDHGLWCWGSGNPDFRTNCHECGCALQTTARCDSDPSNAGGGTHSLIFISAIGA